MTCDRMKDLVHAYIDDELSLTEQVSFEQHLATCPECEQAHRSFTRLRESLQQSNLRFELPPEIQEKLPRPTPSRSFTMSHILALAASIAVLLMGGVLLWTRSNGPTLSQELVDAHVRSLQADHLMDVVSTDQHTVKPWFDGKIDFAPPVRNLADQEYPLIGGRLDYLHNHAVAALVYQHRKHQINVFIWPEGGADEAIKESALNGYQIVEWRQSGMRQVAISDLNATELKQFAQMLH
jgi:anti-sigma factor RsiW